MDLPTLTRQRAVSRPLQMLETALARAKWGNDRVDSQSGLE